MAANLPAYVLSFECEQAIDAAAGWPQFLGKHVGTRNMGCNSYNKQSAYQRRTGTNEHESFRQHSQCKDESGVILSATILVVSC